SIYWPTSSTESAIGGRADPTVFWSIRPPTGRVWVKSLGLQSGRFDDRRPSPRLFGDPFGQLRKRSDLRLETELLKGGLDAGVFQRLVDRSAQPLDHRIWRAGGRQHGLPRVRGQLRETAFGHGGKLWNVPAARPASIGERAHLSLLDQRQQRR